MLFQIIIFLTFFISLFFLSNKTTQTFYHAFFLLTKSKKISLAIILILLLPGTIIHELSHFLIATILFVPVGNITIIPKIEEGRVKAGSVHHADTDIFRRTAIGLAPIIIGLTLIYFLGNFFLSQLTTYNLQPTTLIFIYLLSVVSLSMFSSKKDLETTWFLFPLLALILLSLYFAGIRIGFTENLRNNIIDMVSKMNSYLFITVLLNITVFLGLKGILFIGEKLLKRRILTDR